MGALAGAAWCRTPSPWPHMPGPASRKGAAQTRQGTSACGTGSNCGCARPAVRYSWACPWRPVRWPMSSGGCDGVYWFFSRVSGPWRVVGSRRGNCSAAGSLPRRFWTAWKQSGAEKGRVGARTRRLRSRMPSPPLFAPVDDGLSHPPGAMMSRPTSGSCSAPAGRAAQHHGHPVGVDPLNVRQAEVEMAAGDRYVAPQRRLQAGWPANTPSSSEMSLEVEFAGQQRRAGHSGARAEFRQRDLQVSCGER